MQLTDTLEIIFSIFLFSIFSIIWESSDDTCSSILGSIAVTLNFNGGSIYYKI